MATRPDQAKAAVLDAAVARVREACDAHEADQIERFVRGYYAHVAPEDVIARSDLDLAGAALAHWRLAQARGPGEIKVHVYSPTVEEHGWESPHTVVETVNADMPFLVDSVSMELTRHQNAIHFAIRPIVWSRTSRCRTPSQLTRRWPRRPSGAIRSELKRVRDAQGERLRPA